MRPAMAPLSRPDLQLAARPFETSRLTSLNAKSLSQLRSCPSCGRPMRARSEAEIYECKACRVFVTEPS
jgi:ribosomal protein L37AE/L43A